MWPWLALAHAAPAPDLDPVVGPYRDALIVAAAAPDLDEQRLRDLPVLGELLMHERLGAERALRGALLTDVPVAKGDKGKALDAFLDAVEGHELHDGDKLAFRDVLAAVEGALAAAPAGKARDALLARVTEDRAAVAEIEALYRDEVRKLLGQLEATRGMRPTRERWDAYLDAIRAGRSADAVFLEHAADLDGNAAATRGLEDNAFEIYGTTLPDKTLVLTFDDGPDPTHTAAVLDLLEARGLKAIFFQVGQHVGELGADGAVTETAAAALTRRIVAEGHLLGNHSWSHANLPRVTDAELAVELDRSDAVLDAVAGVDVGYFRPPYGARDARVLREITARSERAYLWNVDSRDWADPIPESIVETVAGQVAKVGRGVLLFHDVHAQTVEALPLLLDRLTAEGYRFALFDGDRVLGERGEAVASAGPSRSSLYAESWAVVIGIDQYRTWPKLSYAVNDAEGVRDALISRYGFPPDHVITLLDGQATRQRVLEVLGDELPRKVGPDDRVVVFFAGHGATRDLAGGGERGFLVPVDADTEHLQARAIPMSTLQDVQESLPAKHVLVVTDACYSGLALTRGAASAGDPRRYIAEVTKRRARQILTAGGADEQVADGGPDGHSIFTFTLLQGLDGAADLDGDGFITASELGGFVAPRVSGLSRQTPAFGSLVGSQGGEVVFALRADQQLLSDATDETAAREVADARKLLAAENDELKAELARMRAEIEKFQTERGPAAPEADAARLHALGLERFREGKLAEAVEAIARAAELAPEDVEIVNNLGYLRQKLGQDAEAVPWLEKAVALDPERAVAWLNLGDSLAALGRDAEATDAYRRYLGMVPDSPVRERLERWLAR